MNHTDFEDFIDTSPSRQVLERKGLELIPRGAPVSEMEALADARRRSAGTQLSSGCL